MKQVVVWRGRSQAQIFAIDRGTAMSILNAIDDYLSTGVGDVKSSDPHDRSYG
jgi:hypothetical protein